MLSTPLVVVLAIVAAAVIGLILLFNGLVRARTRVEEAWSDIDVQLKRRLNLIPNLVATVKGYQTHEATTFEKVTAARAAVLKAATITERAVAEAALGQGIGGLFAVAESYPELKASANFIELQRELTDTENKIQAARRFYNGLVRDYNIRLHVFPATLFAELLGFHPADFFELGDEAGREPVAVNF